MRSLLVATTNPGKIREIRGAMAGSPVRLVTLDDLRSGAELTHRSGIRLPGTTGHTPHPTSLVVEPPEETGKTFAENAMIKAVYYARATGAATVAEDSGLVIDALDGRPGVESARYPGAHYSDKFARLHRELAACPKPWTARYVCSLVFVASDAWVVGPRIWALDHPQAGQLDQGDLQPRFRCECTVEGEIADEPRGKGGFGYDPIFFYPPYETTLADVNDRRKLAVSHRGKAFRELRHWLAARARTTYRLKQ